MLLVCVNVDGKYVDKFLLFEYVLGVKSEWLKVMGFGVKERKAFLREVNL